jgi:hypothetical protein
VVAEVEHPVGPASAQSWEERAAEQVGQDSVRECGLDTCLDTNCGTEGDMYLNLHYVQALSLAAIKSSYRRFRDTPERASQAAHVAAWPGNPDPP